jgi:hypothetical protein
MANQEFSKAGNPLYAFTEKDERKFERTFGEWEYIERIRSHIEQHIGTVSKVLHEVVSDQVHIDVHIVEPSIEFPFFCLITSGMSSKPMNKPGELKNVEYMELMVLLPKDWIERKGDTYDFAALLKDEEHYWPARQLFQLAHYPHKYNTWIGYGHSFVHTNNNDPFTSNTDLCGILLLPSISIKRDFNELKIEENKTVNFFCLWALYKEEMQYKLDKGTDALIEKFIKHGIGDIIYLNRPNACKKNRFLNWF